MFHVYFAIVGMHVWIWESVLCSPKGGWIGQALQAILRQATLMYTKLELLTCYPRENLETMTQRFLRGILKGNLLLYKNHGSTIRLSPLLIRKLVQDFEERTWYWYAFHLFLWYKCVFLKSTRRGTTTVAKSLNKLDPSDVCKDIMCNTPKNYKIMQTRKKRPWLNQGKVSVESTIPFKARVWAFFSFECSVQLQHGFCWWPLTCFDILLVKSLSLCVISVWQHYLFNIVSSKFWSTFNCMFQRFAII